MDKYELIRYGLKKWKMIKDGPSLQERKCEKSWDTDNCYTCLATHICAKRVETFSITFSVENNSSYYSLLFFIIAELKPNQKPKIKP